jgi:hypothetical protein
VVVVVVRVVALVETLTIMILLEMEYLAQQEGQVVALEVVDPMER